MNSVALSDIKESLYSLNSLEKLRRFYRWFKGYMVIYICIVGDYTVVSSKNDMVDETEISFIPMKLIDDGFNNTHNLLLKEILVLQKLHHV